MVLTEAAGDAELVLWDGREFDHWKGLRCHTEKRNSTIAAPSK